MDGLTLNYITVDDVIRGGACADGVYAFLRRVPDIEMFPACLPVGAAITLARDNAPYVQRAANLDGDGDSYGYGYGYGDGNGYGYGDGCGYGYGYGDGDGYGDSYDLSEETES